MTRMIPSDVQKVLDKLDESDQGNHTKLDWIGNQKSCFVKSLSYFLRIALFSICLFVFKLCVVVRHSKDLF